MKLHVDLETLQLIEGPGFRNPVTAISFKRGDAARLDVSFLEGGTSAVSIGDPSALEIRFGIKPRNRYDVGYLVHDAVWAMPAADAEAPVYHCSPSFNTEELNSALGVGSATGTELSEITLMGEITWREGTGEPTSTRTFLVIVENDVNRGTEGFPVSAQPVYPAPESIALASTLNAHLNDTNPHPQYLRNDAQSTLTQQQREDVRASIQAAEVAPDLNSPMQNIAGIWYPAVFDGEPQNSQPEQMIDGTPGWRGRLATVNGATWICTKDDMTPSNDGWKQLSTITVAPPVVSTVTIDSTEQWVTFGTIVAGRNYRVRFDNFSTIPSTEQFGISYVNYEMGVQQMDNISLVASGFLDSYLEQSASVTLLLANGYPSSASELFAEFTFTATNSIIWAGYGSYGYYLSGNSISLNVTLTELP